VRNLIRFFGVVSMILALAGCSSLLSSFSASSLMDTAIGAAMGNQSDLEKVGQLQKAGEAVSSAAQEITPEQEYYIGRAVAATVLSTYKPYANQKANDYLNTLGSGLALASVLPETFSGYHFLVLDTDDINAFGAPSGFILVSRGLLRCATTEDEVAAILAHEIGHVSLKHGLGAISTARWTEAGTQLLKFAAQNSDSQILRDLTASFGGVIGDIVKTMVTSGYSQDLEKQADLEAVRILHDVGYDPRALVRVLQTMETRLKPGAKDFAKTHPDPEVRVAYVGTAIAAQTAAATPSAAQRSARAARLLAGLGKI
jgi:beta-barrel assembly-enhancing protease